MAEWVSGSSTYVKVTLNGADFAVLKGKKVDDREYAFAIKVDKTSKNTYFVNLASRSKSWELPDLGPSPVGASPSFRDRVVAMYQKYNPEKLNTVDSALAKYAGQEEILITALVGKYGPEPAPTPPSTPAVSASPATPSMSPASRTYRDRVVAMYQKYNPDKLSSVDSTLARYAGQEDNLIATLVGKYGPEPAPTPPSTPVVSASPVPVRAPTPPSSLHPSSFRDRVVAMYQKYNPEKLNTVDSALAKYAGQEENLITALVGKYGPEPAPTPPSTPAVSASPARAPTPSMSPASRTYRDRVVAMYQKYNPDKLSSVDSALAKYAGQEENLIATLVGKYGPEPSQSESASTPRSATPATPTGLQSPPAALSYRDRVVAMYQKYNPAKIGSVDKALKQYVGQEETLIATLVKKYGPEPPPEPAPAAAASPPTPTNWSLPRSRTYRERVVALYQKYKPHKLNAVDSALAKYVGQEEELIAHLVRTLGPEPVEDLEASASAEQLPSQPKDSADVTPQPTTEIQPAEDTQKSNGTSGAEQQPASSFGFGHEEEPQSHGPPSEQMLLKFLSERDARLHEAFKRSEQSESRLEHFRDINAKLRAQINHLKEQKESEATALRVSCEKLQQEAEIVRRSWSLEQEKLQASMEVAAVVAQKELNSVKIKFAEEQSRTLSERAQLNDELARVKVELHQHQQTSGDLLRVLDTKDAQLRDLTLEMEQLREKLKGARKESTIVQTEPIDLELRSETLSNVEDRVVAMSGGTRSVSNEQRPQPKKGKRPSPHTANKKSSSDGGSHEPPSSDPLMMEFDELMSKEKYKREEIEAWKNRVSELEADLQRMYSYIATTKDAPVNCVECQKKVKLINTLRMKIKAQEERMEMIELEALSQPGPPVAAQREDQPSVEDAGQLTHQVEELRSQLSSARSTVKDQRKQIQDLRGLLAKHMASPYGIRGT